MKITMVRTTMIASDYKGDEYDIYDCPGHRAFKRAIKQLPWYKRIFIDTGWSTDRSIDGRWYSHKENCRISMMNGTKIGDIIKFVKF